MKNNVKDSRGEIVIYKTSDKQVRLNVKLERETVWLTQKQIAVLFGTERPAITKHLRNVFKSKELDKKSVCSILEHTATDGKTYKTNYYNLDAIISVGYRVNSRRATQFRIWATRVLKDYLVKGYAIDKKRLLKQQEKFIELQQTVAFLKEKSAIPEIKTQMHEILSIINDYANSMTLLFQYDKGKVPVYKTRKPRFVLTYETSLRLIDEFKKELITKDEASYLFGKEVNEKLAGILGAIYQTFEKRDLYGSVEEKAANLLYLTIKDHPFVDGNKRIGSLLFIHYLNKNKCMLNKAGKPKISVTTIVALALLIANSDPKEKEIMINIVTNLLR
ncbi:MAG TPA: virulence protein RhuM/Fic/DOC family protein [bacterium]